MAIVIQELIAVISAEIAAIDLGLVRTTAPDFGRSK
jgi:hypothetical protein